MNILVIQETDWLNRGPHIQHHIFERLSKNPAINIILIDYDIENIQESDSLFIKKKEYENIEKTVKNPDIKIIRPGLLRIKFFRRITWLISNFFEIIKIFKNYRPTIVFNYSISNGLIAFLLAKLYNIPYIFHYIDILHELVPIQSIQKLAKIASKIILQRSDLIFIYSKFHRKFVLNQGVNNDKVKKLPNGISLKNTILNKEKLNFLKEKYNFSEDTFVLFFMGYLYPFAGLKEIIDYYNSKVLDGDLDLRFIILGDGGIYNDLKKYIAEINADWVLLVGRVPYFEITEYIELADLCLLSFEINNITKEITPIKILEYMAMKKPVLSTELPGVKSELGNNNGIIFCKNQENLIIKIEELYFQKKELEEIGLKGFAIVKNRYIWSRIIKKLKVYLLNVLREYQLK